MSDLDFNLNSGTNKTSDWSWSQADESLVLDWLLEQSPSRFEANPLWLTTRYGRIEFVWIKFQEEKVALIPLILVPLKFNYHYIWSPAGPLFSAAWKDKISVDFFSTLTQFFLPEWIQGKIFSDNDNIIFWRLEPDLAADRFTAPKSQWLKSKDIQPAATWRLYLNDSWEKILNGMHPKTRYNINLAQRKNLELKKIVSAENLSAAIDLILATAKRDGYQPHSVDHYQLLWALGQSEDFLIQSRLNFEIYGAYTPEGVLAAAAITGIFGDTMTYLHGGSDYNQRSFMAPQAMQGYLIKKAIEQNLSWYDFYGIAPTDEPNHPWAGITRFKKAFGGQADIRPGTWDVTIDPWAYYPYKIIRDLKLKFRSK